MGMALAKMCKVWLSIVLSSSVSCTAAGSHRASGDNSNAIAATQLPAHGESRPSNGLPMPPDVFLDTTYARPTGRTLTVSGAYSASTFQSALNSSRPGDVISIEAGTTITGNFTLPNKQGTGWITIRSSASDDKLPPPGTRMSPAYASVMPKLVSPNADAVIKTTPGAHHYRFIGVEFTIAAGCARNHGLILLGDGGAQNSPGAVPHDLIIDRCYIHGNPSVDLRRAIALNSASTAIIDSYISDVHEVGADTQAICGWNGPGPFKIVNNYLEAAGENVMFGGADPHIPNLVPSDIEFRRNHCAKPLSWMPQHPSYAGKHWSVKNLFELKNARRTLIDGNLFENNWLDAQSGFAILFTVRNQDGSAPWSAVEDVTFTNNIIRHSAAGIMFIGRDNNHPSQQLKRALVANNLFEDIGGRQWGFNGRLIQITETEDVKIDHNTAFQSGNLITAHGEASRGFVFTNNIAPHNEYGVIGDGASFGNATLGRYFPGGVFKKNVIAGGRSSLYPADNFFPPSTEAVKFVDQAGGNYSLSASSPYKSAATDGRSIGCDMNALRAALDLSQPARAASNSPLAGGRPMRQTRRLIEMIKGGA